MCLIFHSVVMTEFRFFRNQGGLMRNRLYEKAGKPYLTGLSGFDFLIIIQNYANDFATLRALS
jgi:hypothetical protein